MFDSAVKFQPKGKVQRASLNARKEGHHVSTDHFLYGNVCYDG